MINKIIENYPDDDILKADGFDGAIIGFDEKDMKVVYSIEKCIEILCLDMDEEDAWEHFFFNVSGSYVGERTPSFIYTFPINKQQKRELKLNRIINEII